MTGSTGPPESTASTVSPPSALIADGAAPRVEREGRVIHAYGHGGAGMTLSWGTADEVVRLARRSCRAPLKAA